jgi:predicted transcriptional regulator
MLPCGEVHWKILPAISRELAVSMGREGLTQREIAVMLGTTSAAISQYMSGKRGSVSLSPEAAKSCRILARRIAKGQVKGRQVDIEISKILAIAKKSGLGKNDPCVICMSSQGAHPHS